MLSREERCGRGQLALLVAVYGLALAPVLHAAYGHGGGLLSAEEQVSPVPAGGGAPLPPPRPHDARESHAHGPAGEAGPDAPPPRHTHASFSVEHLQAVAVPTHALEPPRVAWVEVHTGKPGRPRPRAGAPLRPTAMPQGP